ncbi:hypothetical protein K503DRAFT_772423 [Rhizopogon vinicolor AM-OR11-026]|uniref:Rhodanese domain-containing protein n=1 Tax=Rhizopogon vinicolor AM-OR11-026 TaxID=1314800 RepID=A0A1B7MVB8_9AGAM|nr:hypothetical protein K503DRAFT_772423 [Rhizopogon vinicolor AM-OR11-026]
MMAPKLPSFPIFATLLLACLFLLASASPIIQLPRDNDIIVDVRDDSYADSCCQFGGK